MTEEMAFKLMDLVRGKTLKWVEDLDSAIVDVKPVNYNNTLRWNAGHILFVQERLTFGFNQESLGLPEEYKELFGNGTKPADWTAEPPSMQTLLQQLGGQGARIRRTFQGRLEEKMAKTFQGMETIGEVLLYSVQHESWHQGYMNALKKCIEAASVQH